MREEIVEGGTGSDFTKVSKRNLAAFIRGVEHYRRRHRC